MKCSTIIAMVASLGLVLVTIIVLSTEGIKADGPILIGLVGAVSLLCGGIVGNKQQEHHPSVPQTPQIPQLPQVSQLPQQTTSAAVQDNPTA